MPLTYGEEMGFQAFSMGEIPLSKKKHAMLRAEVFQGWEWDAFKILAFVSYITVLNYQINQGLWGSHKNSSLKGTLILLGHWVSLSKSLAQNILRCLWGLKEYICFPQRRTQPLRAGLPALLPGKIRTSLLETRI